MNAIALQRTVADLVEEYDLKAAAIADEIAAFELALTRVKSAASVGGAYGGDVFGRYAAAPHERDMRKALLVSGWKAIYDRLQIDRLATANDKRLWERTIADPPPLTMDNAKATFADYILRAPFHILRGLAETFSGLDPAYRSHAKVKIGVKGLPKRIILTSVSSYGSYGRDKLRDVLNALAAYQGLPGVEHYEFSELDKLHTLSGHKAGEVVFNRRSVKVPRAGKDEEVLTPNRGVTVRKFQNGNAHVIFDTITLMDINKALAEFYGDVLPDVEEPDAKRAPGTAVAKDLQFYPTPQAVIEQALYEARIERPDEWRRAEFRPLRVLEPSCGDGRFLDEIRTRGHRALGIEVHAGRAAEARAKGHSVLRANFLEQPPTPDFDRVVMNPPFYGRHYVKHVQHAFKFLKPGGILVAVLPASAWYDHGDLKGGRWTDLPVASFAESGTNIPTGILVIANRN